MHTKFEVSSFTYSKDMMKGSPKFKNNGSVTPTTPILW